ARPPDHRRHGRARGLRPSDRQLDRSRPAAHDLDRRARADRRRAARGDPRAGVGACMTHVVVLGGGSSAEAFVAALRRHDTGSRVTLIERELVGGECTYWACMPSKTLLRATEL